MGIPWVTWDLMGDLGFPMKIWCLSDKCWTSIPKTAASTKMCRRWRAVQDLDETHGKCSAGLHRSNPTVDYYDLQLGDEHRPLGMDVFPPTDTPNCWAMSLYKLAIKSGRWEIPDILKMICDLETCCPGHRVISIVKWKIRIRNLVIRQHPLHII